MSRRMVLVVLLSLWVAGCATPQQPITNIALEARDFAYGPDTIAVPAGREITLVFKNSGQVEHDFVVERINVTNVVARQGEPTHRHMDPVEYDLHISALPGSSGTLVFTPMEPGIYEIFCSVEGHKEAGMVGQLVVSDTQN